MRPVLSSSRQPAILLLFAALLASLPGEVAREFVARTRQEQGVTAASAKTLLCRLATEVRTQKQSGARQLLEQVLSLPATQVVTGPSLIQPLTRVPEQTATLDSHYNTALFQRPPPSLFLG